MLEQNNFYTLKSFSNTEQGKIRAEIELNATHTIFKGHFPGSPVVPGVCLIQITKEILEKSISSATDMLASSNVKFLAVVDPAVNPILQIALEINEQDNLISASSTISSGEKVFFKFKGNFKRNVS